MAPLYCLIKYNGAQIKTVYAQGISVYHIGDLHACRIQRTELIQARAKTTYIQTDITDNLVRFQALWRYHRRCIRIISNPRNLLLRELGIKIPLPSHPERGVHRTR